MHARSVVATAIDTRTGELFKERLVPSNEVVIDWVHKRGESQANSELNEDDTHDKPTGGCETTKRSCRDERRQCGDSPDQAGEGRRPPP